MCSSLGAFSAACVLALALAGCQDAYPIAATRCDRWCALREPTLCGDYNPAACVVACEENSGGPACDATFDDELRCLEAQRQALVCDHTGLIRVCQTEQEAQLICSEQHAPHGQKSSE